MTVTAIRTLAETAMASERFSMFCKAVQTAHLVDMLKQAGPYTVFAPTNEAFKKLPKDKLNALLDNPESLRNILKHHVVRGAISAEQLAHEEALESIAGSAVEISASPRGVWIQDASIIEPDIECSNGVLHAIDDVLTPPERQ